MRKTPFNIAVAGGTCTGKTTLAARLFAELKERGRDYDLILEEHRRLKREMGPCRSPFDRFYLWRQQEREEQRVMAVDGFVTDWPLFHFYAAAKIHASEPRDELAVRELLRMCHEIRDRYQLIIMAENHDEIPYRKDRVRRAEKSVSRLRHDATLQFLQMFHSEKLFFVCGNVEQRVQMVLKKLKLIGQL